MTSICFVRHGETDWNALGKIQGQTDIPLNNNGRSQADECGRYLQDFEWDVMITSPLQRAKETATIINKYLDLSLTEMNDFRERGFGDVEGMTFQERLEAFPDGIYPNQESFEELTERLVEGLQEIHQIHKGRKVLLVAHGAVINAILTNFSDGKIGSGKTRLVNGCINHIEWIEEVWQIKSYNQTGHLSAFNEKGKI
ncbi:histidine phosphatase family protein [Gracilibacillus salitolerans]|uniref:Histidine phosphatase family protein n=1 Tax=Gracilibacillus salitolerans TaxID=2663022 RepID=A0A5Q2TI96_9BACI|nr:histidine phosphatase family protein [Gracilibacillus salitolerans]QGH33847.1 histidine phosphatase family protein [Gracilibacillus salitolerans]